MNRSAAPLTWRPLEPGDSESTYDKVAQILHPHVDDPEVSVELADQPP